MGLTAPIAAVLAAALPTAYGMRMEGTPDAGALIGFLLAGLGIWLISRPEGEPARPAGLSLAVLAGLGFAGFFISINRVGDSSVFWSAAFSRLGSFLSVAAIVLVRRGRHRLDIRDAVLALFAGSLDVIGTALFIRADQTGRFDAAVVLTSLYPAVTVVLARIFLKEHFTRWRTLGILAALAAVPMIALQ
jgi:drug/metabolite transporter (DMT)-like permease